MRPLIEHGMLFIATPPLYSIETGKKGEKEYIATNEDLEKRRQELGNKPYKLQRFKGLGEMDGKRLFDSTVDPEKRTLVRYTVEDAQKELETMRFLNDNKIKLLEDVQVSRFDIMG